MKEPGPSPVCRVTSCVLGGAHPCLGLRDGPNTEPSTGYVLREYSPGECIKIRRAEERHALKQIKRIVANMKQCLLKKLTIWKDE